MDVSISYLYYLAVRALRVRPHLTSYRPTLSSLVPRQESSPAQVAQCARWGKKASLLFLPMELMGLGRFLTF